MPTSKKIDYFKHLSAIVELAIEEDIGSGDITAQLIPEDQKAHADVICREEAVVCGRPWFDEVFKQIDNHIRLHWHVEEGQLISANDTLVSISGSARSILTAERAALNFLQTLMGTATTARTFADKLDEFPIKVLDTRKTIPGLRLAQKYAVKTGGGENHRIGLYDAFLIKENHINAAGSIANAIREANRIAPGKPVEVEVENIEELKQAIEAGADRVMLDNFSDGNIRDAIEIKPEGIEYEISGNVDEKILQKYAKAGIDFISSGALTKHVQAIDLSMRFLHSS